jgi:CYTH domain-containing protein
MTELSLMRTTRCFLLAPSLARLIEKERGGHQVMEGYFADQPRGNTYVRLEEGIGSLVLVRHGSGERVEEPTDLPCSQTEALLELTSGGVTYRRIPLSLGPSGAQVLRFTAPGSLDLISVEFERDDDVRDFQPLPWFGPEVTTEPSYQNRALALAGLPDTPDVELTDAALTSLLDALEHRAVVWQPPQQRAWLKQRAAS